MIAAAASSSAAASAPPSPRTGTDRSVALPLLAVHLLGLGLAPLTFTRAGLIACAAMYLVTGLGVTAGAHRLFTHRAFRPTPITRDLLALAFLLSAQGSLRRWVRDHHIHHVYSDDAGDPHSPERAGFFSAHFGWLWKRPPTRAESRDLYQRFTHGLDIGRVGRFFERGGPLVALHLGALAMAYLTGAIIEAGVTPRAIVGGAHTGLSLVVWGGLLRIVLVMHSTFLVNSAAHRWGSRRYATREGSRNLWWVALLALGEGWHNNHHSRAAAANNGFHRFWEIDLTFLVVLALGALGLCSDVRVYRARQGKVEIWWKSTDASGAGG